MSTFSSELLQSVPEIVYTFIDPNKADITLINTLFKKYIDSQSLKEKSFEEYLLNEVLDNKEDYSYQIIYTVAFFSFFRGKIEAFNLFIKKNLSLNYPPIYILEALEQLLFYNNATKALELLKKALDLVKPDQNENIYTDNKFNSKVTVEARCLSSFAWYILNNIENCNINFDLASKELVKSNFTTDIFFFCYYFRGEALILHDVDKALTFTEEAFNIDLRKKNRYFIGLTLRLKGMCFLQYGESISAYLQFLKAKECFEEVRATPFIALLQSNLGELEKNVGRYIKAIDHFKTTIVEGELLQAPKIEFAGINGIADLYLAQFNLNLALDSYKKALEKCKSLHDYILTSQIVHQIGAIQITLEPEKSHQTLLYAISLQDKYNINKIKSLIAVGQFFIFQNDIEKAKIMLQILRNQPVISGIGPEINLYHVQILIAEKKFENARNILENLNNIRHGFEFHIQLRILLFLFQLEISLYKQQNDQLTLEEADNWLKELRILALKPNYPVINTLFYLLESIWIFLYNSDKTDHLIQNLHSASKIAQSYGLIYLEEQVEKYLRQFNRTRVKLGFPELNTILSTFLRAIMLILIKI